MSWGHCQLDQEWDCFRSITGETFEFPCASRHHLELLRWTLCPYSISDWKQANELKWSPSARFFSRLWRKRFSCWTVTVLLLLLFSDADFFSSAKWCSLNTVTHLEVKVRETAIKIIEMLFAEMHSPRAYASDVKANISRKWTKKIDIVQFTHLKRVIFSGSFFTIWNDFPPSTFSAAPPKVSHLFHFEQDTLVEVQGNPFCWKDQMDCSFQLCKNRGWLY